MSVRSHQFNTIDDPWAWPRWWRWTVLALSTLILCSCSSQRAQMSAQQASLAAQAAPAMAAEAVAMRLPGAPLAGEPPQIPDIVPTSAHLPVPAVAAPPVARQPAVADTPLSQLANPGAEPLPIVPLGSCGCCPPRPMHACSGLQCGNGAGCCAPCGGQCGPCAGGQWRPPGLDCPWPSDEYICDGGDQAIPANVGRDWSVEGLEPEDTIAHYDTVDGKRIVEPSNKVCLYAPRFGAVRTVTYLNENMEVAGPVGVEQPEQLHRRDEVQIATTSLQNEMALKQKGLGRAGAYVTPQGDGILAQTIKARALQDALLPYEDLQIIKFGIFKQAEEARLAEAHDAAITWSHDQAVQVIIDEQAAAVETADKSVEEIYTIDSPTKARLRICKIASTDMAKPGDIVEFTIRFDNVGPTTIGNVTIIDNLTTRLEFVPDSAQSSRDAAFFHEANDANSLMLRWEIDKPLEPGEGGIIHFRCKVR